MSMQARHAVVGDIGGTHARFGIADIDELRIDHYASFECSGFASLDDVLAAYLRSMPNHPKAISLAVAGPVVGDAVEMTNLPWTVTKRDIAAASGAEQICLINDFNAAALSLPYLGHHDVIQIGGAAAPDRATKAVLGAGTGLGVAALAWAGGDWFALPGEGGHMAFAAQTAEEFDIVSQIGRDTGYVSCEHLLSGAGLVRLYGLLGEQSDALTAPDIVHRAAVDSDPVAIETVRLFAAWLGRFAGDVALLYGARGGIYVAGGIAPRILSFLSDGHFRAAFEAKGQLSSYLAEIPIHLVKTPQAGMMGAALAYARMLETEPDAPVGQKMPAPAGSGGG